MFDTSKGSVEIVSAYEIKPARGKHVRKEKDLICLGKSSILSAILGEMETVAGKVTIRDLPIQLVMSK